MALWGSGVRIPSAPPVFQGTVIHMIDSVDTNIWGFLAVPVGVLLCFGPALFVWVKDEYFSRPPGGPEGDL